MNSVPVWTYMTLYSRTLYLRPGHSPFLHPSVLLYLLKNMHTLSKKVCRTPLVHRGLNSL